MNLNGQDWGEVVFKKKKPTGAAAHSEQAVNAALRAGQPVETVKKYAAGTNKAKAAPVKDAAKLDRETEELHHDRIPTELKKRIMQARLDKKLTQAQLGQLINEKPQVIQEYESGKAIPSPAVLSKLSRVLGVQLSVKAVKASSKQ
eukprot:jgi/Botrbrau1/20781/Bobra.0156s0012.1